MRKFRLAAAVAVTLGTIAALPLGGGPAYAVAPTATGWWTAANAGPASLPVGPDVPKGGMLVEGGYGSAKGAADGNPVAYGAVVYQFDAGAPPDALKLTVAPSSASTPTAVLQLCPLKSATVKPAQGGPIADAPAFSCSKSVTASLPSGGSSYEFDVSSLSADGVLAVAILPTSPSDRVAFAAPDADSLPTAPPSSDSAATTPGVSDSAATDSGQTADSALGTPASTDFAPSTGSLPTTPASAGLAPTTPASATPSTPPASNFQTAPASIVGEANKTGVALLAACLLIGLAAWNVAGRRAVRTALGEVSET